MKIGYLGVGTWGYCLSCLLAAKGYQVTVWSSKQDLVDRLNQKQDHPVLQGHFPLDTMKFTTNMEEALEDADLLVESVTSAGIRPVFEQVKEIIKRPIPIVITSKGIEQHTDLILAEVIIQVLGEEYMPLVGALSGPGYAIEVIKGLPTSVVGSAYSKDIMLKICEAFTTGSFRVYPNSDMMGVAYGGALKNIIAIAAGISDGLKLGTSAKATLMTRGLHEIKKIGIAKGCRAETLNGLSGMGDICLTCNMLSRNFRFGHLLAEGFSVESAREKIGAVVEGAYTVVSALELSEKLNVPLPITEAVKKIIYDGLDPWKSVGLLMERPIKEEPL